VTGSVRIHVDGDEARAELSHRDHVDSGRALSQIDSFSTPDRETVLSSASLDACDVRRVDPEVVRPRIAPGQTSKIDATHSGARVQYR
jgi:hypothetical protein